MTRTLLVTAPEESTGKTAVAVALARIARDRGAAVGYMKPKGTRLQSNVGKTVDEDPLLATELLGLDADLDELEPIVYSPTFVREAMRGREDPDELRERVRDRFRALAADRDFVAVEGGGTVTTGGVVDLTDGDVAEVIDADVLLVTRYERPGDVDDVLAAVDRAGDRLAGVLFNAVADADFDEVGTTVAPFLESRSVPVAGVLPHDRSLAGVTVETLADELGAETLTGDGLDGLVERFSVGAMSADAALRHFRRARNAAVITGGDRSEIHSVALEAPGVACLVLTGGLRPPGAILGTAEERGVPVLLVDADTLATVERAEDVVRSGRTRDAATVERMASLLSDHADVDDLLRGVGGANEE